MPPSEHEQRPLVTLSTCQNTTQRYTRSPKHPLWTSNSLNCNSRLTSRSRVSHTLSHKVQSCTRSLLNCSSGADWRRLYSSASVRTAPELEGSPGPAETFGTGIELHPQTHDAFALVHHTELHHSHLAIGLNRPARVLPSPPRHPTN